jgi:hypothetical protein
MGKKILTTHYNPIVEPANPSQLFFIEMRVHNITKMPKLKFVHFRGESTM